MTKAHRLGTALTAIGLVTVVTGCSSPGSSAPKSASIFGGKVDQANIGLATRAQVALAANKLDEAIELGERAVANSPRDAGFRALLGNIYLASGRYGSAEMAYHDSLSLVGSQPQVALKLALVEIALGRKDEAVNLLAAAKSILDVSDVGLALALAGRANEAIELLEPAARAVGADGRLRQNLALAHALAGDWDSARIIAAQDVAPDQLDTRMQQWMALASPDKAGQQVAAFIGIAPIASDPGQPTRLALDMTREQIRTAAINPLPMPRAPHAIAAPAPVTHQLAYAPPARPAVPAAPVAAEIAEAPILIDTVAPASIELASVPVKATAAPSKIVAALPKPAPARMKQASAPAPVAAVAFASARPALTPAAVRLSQSLPELRRAAMPRNFAGRSRAVVQLGAYSSRERIAIAWNRVTARYGSLKGFTPVTARFDGAQGTVYRLAVKGFASDREAINLCVSLKRSGANCFVRATSGDAPVQFAAR